METSIIDELVSLPSVFGPTRSPDGKWLLTTIMGLHDNAEVYAINVENPEERIRLTNNKEFSRAITWWPDSQSVIIGEDIDRNERVTYYRIFLDTPEEYHALTHTNPNYFIRGCEITQDGKNLYYSANYSFAEQKETESWGLFKHHLETGEITELTRSTKNSALYPQLSEDNNKLLFTSSELDPAGRQAYLIDINGTNQREILNFGAKGYIVPSWHPNSQQIVFSTNYYADTLLPNSYVGIYSLETQAVQWVNKDDEFMFEELVGHDFSYAYISKYAPEYLQLSETQRAKSQKTLIHLEEEKMIQIPRIPGNVTFSTKLSDDLWYGSYYSSTQPNTIVKIPHNKIKTLTREDLMILFDNFESSALTPEQLVPAEDYDWKAADGTAIHGWLYKTKEPTDKLMVYVHGGPTAHSQDRLNVEIQYYLSQGFNVLDPNYRGSTGYGIAFQEKIKEDGWGGREQQDIAAGVETLIQEDIVAKGKVGITGTSYGGFSSYCAITMYPDTFQVSAPVCGMTDLVVDYYSTRPDLRPYSEQMMGGTPEEVRERYDKGSPIHYINQIKGRLLIVQGAQDPNVTMDNVREVEGALRNHEVEYETLIFPDEGHGIIKKENRKTKMERIASFTHEMLNDMHEQK